MHTSIVRIIPSFGNLDPFAKFLALEIASRAAGTVPTPLFVDPTLSLVL